MSAEFGRRLAVLVGLTAALGVLAPDRCVAHPLGNFSISHYGGIRIEHDEITLRYFIDTAEIPTFQEIQSAGIVPEAGHPSIGPYLASRVDALTEGVIIEVDGQRLALRAQSIDAIFPPGAGGLPTMKLGIVYRARLQEPAGPVVSRLHYRDSNFPNRAGWKEIIATPGQGVALVESSVPETDRSHELSDYPVDLLNSPPQILEALVLFAHQGARTVVAGSGPPAPDHAPRAPARSERIARADGGGAEAAPSGRSTKVLTGLNAIRPAEAPTRAAATSIDAPGSIRLQANRQAGASNAFSQLVATNKELSFGILLVALAVALSLGAFHALEPGHGKTVVAAYLVGSRGTPWHAVLLGLIVTASHTAGVYLLGAVTLYASRHVVPERLYPWLGVLSGLIIAGLGASLFLRRYAGHEHSDADEETHEHGHGSHSHGPGERGHGSHGHSHDLPAGVSLSQLFALGVSGGIVPCPAALVVLLSAISLGRVGFGLLLIVSFSVGLAAVLIGVGLLVVCARRFMARFSGEGRLFTRWLPLTSSAVVTTFGLAIAVQALLSAGIIQIKVG